MLIGSHVYKMGRYLLAIDGSKHSMRAFEFYKASVHKEFDELVLIHAIEPQHRHSGRHGFDELEDDHRKDAKAKGSAVCKIFNDLCTANDIKCIVIIEFAHPGEYIVQTAKDLHVTGIIIGTRGLGTIRRTVMGSVSDYVLHHSNCPVVVVKE